MSEPLCLEFANTVRWHASAAPAETLHSYADLLSWAQQNGPLPARDIERLAQLAGSEPARAADVYERAVALREAIYRIFVAHARGGAADAEDLALLNGELARGLAHARLAPGDAAYTWGWAGEAAHLDAPLWPVVRSAAELLTASRLLERVGQCADDRGCGWLFLDLSKNHSRRWCDINDCGNRAKQRRHYARARSTA
jgi:predicted RNA-binding Zn ribbon-like protein